MDARTPRQRTIGVLTLLGSAMSNQLGAAVGSFAFPVIGPLGVVVVRQWVAAAILLPIARPRFWRYSWQQWWPILLLGVVFGTMNLTLYSSIERIGLGLAVTLEFLGPLAIALIGAKSKLALLCAVVAAGGVVALTHPQLSTDYLGVALGLVAASCWAAYILLNRIVGQRVSGVQGAAMATGVSATIFLPIGIVFFATHPPTGLAVLCAIGAGVLASAVPYVADLVALRRVPTHLFGLLMSVQPIFAALVGLVVLRQPLEWLEWLGVALIVAANAFALSLQRPAAR